MRKSNNGTFSRKTLEFGQERLQTSERENNNTGNLEKYLNIDNLPEVKALASEIMCRRRNPRESAVPQQRKIRKPHKKEKLRSLCVSKIYGLHTQQVHLFP